MPEHAFEKHVVQTLARIESRLEAIEQKQEVHTKLLDSHTTMLDGSVDLFELLWKRLAEIMEAIRGHDREA